MTKKRYKNVWINPISAPPAISQVELTWKRREIKSAAMAMIIVSGSIRAVDAIWRVTPSINPSEAAFTPSSAAPAQADVRRRGTKRLLIAT